MAILTVARPGGPVRALDLDSATLLHFLEGLVREEAGRAEQLDEWYAEAAEALRPVPVVSKAERRNELSRLARIFA